MLVDTQQRGLDPARTATLIGKVVDEINWHIAAQDYS
jgi:hypothetical protein